MHLLKIVRLIAQIIVDHPNLLTLTIIAHIRRPDHLLQDHLQLRLDPQVLHLHLEVLQEVHLEETNLKKYINNNSLTL